MVEETRLAGWTDLGDVKNSANRKFPVNTCFKGLKLQYADFRNASLIGADFTDCDLRYANFTGANCFGANFTNAILYMANMAHCTLESSIFKPKDAYGITITLRCETYASMEIDATWLKVWLFVPAIMKLPEIKDKPDYWLNRIIEFLGPSTYTKFKAVFNRRVI